MSWSESLPSDFSPNRLTEILSEKRKSNQQIIDLTVSNPTTVGLNFPPLEPVEWDAVRTYDPDPRGSIEARHHIAAYRSVSPDDLILTPGTSESYSWLFKLLTNPGDSILVPKPGYPLLDVLAPLDRISCEPYFLRLTNGKDWLLDIQSLNENSNKNIKAVVAVNPNNPTGSLFSDEEWKAVFKFCKQRRIPLIIDEVFREFVLDGEPRTVPLDPDVLTFSLDGLSKCAACPQVKLGWIHVAGSQKLKMEALTRLDFIADAYLPVSSYAQAIVGQTLSRVPEVRRILLERTSQNLLHLESLGGASFRMVKPKAGWVIPIHVLEFDEDELTEILLREFNVLVQPGHFYEFTEVGWTVLSCICDRSLFAEGTNKLANVVP